MDLFNLKLIEIIFRYAHIFAVILWIGNSYFFTYVDNKIQKNITNKGIDAEGILQHSGIFYRLSRFKGVPDQFEKLEKKIFCDKYAIAEYDKKLPSDLEKALKLAIKACLLYTSEADDE